MATPGCSSKTPSVSLKEFDRSILIVRALYVLDPVGFDLKSWADKARIASGDVVQLAVIGLDGYLIGPRRTIPACRSISVAGSTSSMCCSNVRSVSSSGRAMS